MASVFALDDRATTGFSNASQYDKYRASYPDDAVEALLGHLNLSGIENARIIDLASGTGKFTECKKVLFLSSSEVLTLLNLDFALVWCHAPGSSVRHQTRTSVYLAKLLMSCLSIWKPVSV